MYKSDIIAFLSRPENKNREFRPSEIVDFLLMPLRIVISKEIRELEATGYIDVVDKVETTVRYISLLPQKDINV